MFICVLRKHEITYIDFSLLTHFNYFCIFQVNRSAPSKKILIYLTMQPVSERNYGMEVICLSNARVQDLIGLICWMYTNEGKEPKLM